MWICNYLQKKLIVPSGQTRTNREVPTCPFFLVFYYFNASTLGPLLRCVYNHAGGDNIQLRFCFIVSSCWQHPPFFDRINSNHFYRRTIQKFSTATILSALSLNVRLQVAPLLGIYISFPANLFYARSISMLSKVGSFCHSGFVNLQEIHILSWQSWYSVNECHFPAFSFFFCLCNIIWSIDNSLTFWFSFLTMPVVSSILFRLTSSLYFLLMYDFFLSLFFHLPIVSASLHRLLRS